MNQLQNLLHDALINTNHVQSCAIIRRKDAALRAASVGFHVSNIILNTIVRNSVVFTIILLLYMMGNRFSSTCLAI